MHPSKLVKLLRSPKSGRRQGKSSPRGDSHDTSKRPALNITQPDGIATRYHSAATQLAASSRDSFLANQTVDEASVELSVGVTGVDSGAIEGREKAVIWPDVLIVTGMEDCDSPLQIKICDMVKQSRTEREDGVGMTVIWVRDEEKADQAPAWLVSLVPRSKITRDMLLKTLDRYVCTFRCDGH